MVQGILNIPKRYILADWFVNQFLSTHHQVHVHAKSLQSCPTLYEPWTVAHQVFLCPMGFSRQEYWNGLQCSPPGDLADPRIEHVSLLSPALASRFLTTSATWEDPWPGGGGNMPEELRAGRRDLTGHLKLVSLPEPIKHSLTRTVSPGLPETTQREACLTQSLTHSRNPGKWALFTLPASSTAVLSFHTSALPPSWKEGRQKESDGEVADCGVSIGLNYRRLE